MPRYLYQLICRFIALTILTGIPTWAFAQSGAITIQRDIQYGAGLVDISTTPRLRPLYLDAYLPMEETDDTAPRPAVILAFGGAYHRGGKRYYEFSEDGAHDSSMAEYCEALARRSIACFSIDYRLTPEDPALPDNLEASKLMPKALLNSPLVTGRVETVRQRMDLPALDETSRQQLWNATFAAVQDMGEALSFIQTHAQDYNIDADRIAIGGFSAGAMTAINLAYGEGADVGAVLSLSGTMWGYNLSTSLTESGPPILIFAGQWDLPGIQHGSAAMSELFNSKNISVSQAWVPNFGHFYPMEAPSLSSGFSKKSVIDRTVEYLNENL